MSNNLKKFIRDNRNEFDDKLPSANVWEQIEDSISPEKKRKKTILRPLYKWTMAAAAVLILGTGVYFVLFDKKPTDEPTVTSGSGDPEFPDTEITPQVSQFVKMIDMKQAELRTLAAGQPELYKKFTGDLDQLDSSYNALKTQLNAAPNREMLLEAMIQNLQLQLSVLNQQLNIINQIKQSKKNSHEKNDQSI